MATFVLVHGAWHGGWCWQKVREILEQHRHRVFTPTLTGSGERAHLISADITLDTLTRDVANLLHYEELKDVILVGHSFGGTLISAVAEAVPDRVRQLVYFDAAILENGESMFSRMSPELAAQRRQLAQQSSQGLSLPLPDAASLGIREPQHWNFLARRLTPQPLSSYDSPLRLKSQPGHGLPCSYIACTAPAYGPLAWARARAREYGWPIIPIAAGHCAMVSAPQALSVLLMQLSALPTSAR